MEELEGAICLFVSVMIINQVISFKVYLVDFIYILFLHILLVRNNFSAKEKKGVGGEPRALCAPSKSTSGDDYSFGNRR